jgi:hypothetical protein
MHTIKYIILLVGILAMVVLSASTKLTPSHQTGVKIVYSYDTVNIDSLRITVAKNDHIIYDQIHTSRSVPDSIILMETITLQDTIELVFGGYKNNHWCFPHIDRFTKSTYVSTSYGFNFDCVKLKTNI